MATCPQCGLYLDDEHRCRERWRLRLRILAWNLRSAAFGGLCGSLLLFLIYGRVSVAAIGLAAAIGVLVEKGLGWGPP